MRFRRRAVLVDAIRLDGSEAAFRAVLAIPGATVAKRADGLEISTPSGRRFARVPQWVTHEPMTGAIRVHDHGDFHADHEVAG